MPAECPLVLPLKVPFSVVRAVYGKRYSKEMDDPTVVEIYGGQWLGRSRKLQEEGLTRCMPLVVAVVELPNPPGTYYTGY